jgi:hypothetical protein
MKRWWTIGGRYDGIMQGQLRSLRPLKERHLLTNNRHLVSRLPAGVPCHAVVTPDGSWHEGPVGDDTRGTSSFTPAKRAAYLSRVEAWAYEWAALLQTYHDCIAIGIDYGSGSEVGRSTAVSLARQTPGGLLPGRQHVTCARWTECE